MAVVVKKIVVLGPECSGKTTLVQTLGRKYRVAWAEEFSRGYAEALRRDGGEIGPEDVMPIVHGQIDLEERAVALGGPFVFLDGNPLAEAVYSRWYYGTVPQELEDLLVRRSYDLYLLCYPDIAWEPDLARDMPTGREEIFVQFEQAVARSGSPYRVVRGIGAARTACAEEALRACGMIL